MPASPKSAGHIQALSFERVQKDLFSRSGEGSLLAQLLKEHGTGVSSQGYTIGKKEHPFDRHMVKSLLLANEHHSTCIHAKVNATVGLGHVTTEERAARKMVIEGDPKGMAILQMSMGNASIVDDVLDPMTEHSWQESQSDVGQDFFQVGDGYLEVVRADPGSRGLGPITGLHHLPSEEVHMVLEKDNYNRHFEISGGEDATATRRFAVFGDLQDFKARLPDLISSGLSGSMGTEGTVPGNISEVIQFRQPTALSRWYGYPDWLAAVATIELVQCLRQWKYDFFNNRGVPEFMLFILGQRLGKDEWDVVKTALQSNVGKGNSHKSLALNLEGSEIEVQLERLALDGKGDDSFDKTSESLAVSIVTAHRVPPLLAGILVPGKLGANNELPNSLIAFQTLVIGQAQRIFQRTLANTLGGEFNGGLGLTGDDFEYRKITDAYDLGAMDTMGKMQQTMPEAQAEGRDMTDGVRKEAGQLARDVYDLAKKRGQDRLVQMMEEYLVSEA